MTRPHDITGRRFGALVAIRREGGRWLCECACGGTRLARPIDLIATVERGGSPRCRQCVVRRPNTYALLYRGELRTMPDISRMTGIPLRTLHRWIAEGRIDEARVDARVRRAADLKAAKAAGVSPDTAHARRLLWGDCPDVYTLPLGGRRAAGRKAG